MKGDNFTTANYGIMKRRRGSCYILEVIEDGKVKTYVVRKLKKKNFIPFSRVIRSYKVKNFRWRFKAVLC